jgi:hypothetical protein
MTTIDIETIDERIKVVRIEQATLQQNFDAMVARFQVQTEEHNRQLVQGQQRFQQLAGMLAELQYLREQLLAVKGDNGEVTATKNRVKK